MTKFSNATKFLMCRCPRQRKTKSIKTIIVVALEFMSGANTVLSLMVTIAIPFSQMILAYHNDTINPTSVTS